MKDFVGSDAQRTYRGGDTLWKLLKLHFEPPAGARRTGEEDLHRLVGASAKPRWSRDLKIIATTRELSIKDEEGKPAEVIPVEVADEDRVDFVGIDPSSLEGNE
jgi:hypothetical protein